MAIRITDELKAATVKGKLGSANQIFLTGDSKTVQSAITEHGTAIDAIEDDIQTVNHNHQELLEALENVVTPEDPTMMLAATNVEYTNTSSELTSILVQGAIDELNSKIGRTYLEAFYEGTPKVLTGITDNSTQISKIIFDKGTSFFTSGLNRRFYVNNSNNLELSCPRSDIQVIVLDTEETSTSSEAPTSGIYYTTVLDDVTTYHIINGIKLIPLVDSNFKKGLSANEFLFGIVHYYTNTTGDPSSNEGMIKINCISYYINNVKYRNDMPTSLPETVNTVISSLERQQAKLDCVYNEALYDGNLDINTIINGNGINISVHELTEGRKAHFWTNLNNDGSPSKAYYVKGTVVASNALSDSDYGLSVMSYLYLDTTEIDPQPNEEPDNGIYYTQNDTKVWVKGLKFRTRGKYKGPENSHEYLVGLVNFYHSQPNFLFSQEGVIRINATSYTIDGVKYYNSYPKNDVGKLRVLHIGNSFTVDTTSYLDDIINNDSDKILAKNLYVKRFTYGGSKINDWYGWFEENDYRENSHREGMDDVPTPSTIYAGDYVESDITWPENAPMQDYLKNPWDIVIIQQFFSSTPTFSQYDNLPKLITLIKNCCTNKNVKIGLHVPWAWGGISYSEICAVTQQAVSAYNVDFVIPTGTAVENARLAFDGNYSHDLLRDDLHIGYGVGRYTLASTWWEAVIKPWSGVSILGCTLNKSEATPVGNDYIEVNNSNRLLTQWCGIAAVQNKWTAVSLDDKPTYTSDDRKALAANRKEPDVYKRVLSAIASIEKCNDRLESHIATALSGNSREWQKKNNAWFLLGDYDENNKIVTNQTCKRWRINFLTNDKTGGEITIEAQTVIDYLTEQVVYNSETGDWADNTHKENLTLYSNHDDSGKLVRVVLIPYVSNDKKQAYVNHIIREKNGTTWVPVKYYTIFTQAT